MRVQPHLPSRPFTAMVTCSPGAARLACSAAKRPAPPDPRTRMSVRTRFRIGSRPRLEDPEPGEVGGAVGALHALQRGHGGVLLAGVELRLAEAQLRVLGALEAALLDALLDEGEALVGLPLVDVLQADAHEVVAGLGGLRVLLF